MMTPDAMKLPWSTTVFPIAAIFSFRMLGLFMLIPVFTIYAPTLRHATPALIGFALGAYGLSQGLLQIPFGMLSDRVGRKPMITIGLLLFALGSLFGALTDSIYGMIAARIIQGMGAIGSVLIALLADLTPEQERTKAMAVIGASIGLSFSIALLISPAMTSHYGFASIFYFASVLSFVGLLLLHTLIPSPTHTQAYKSEKAMAARFSMVIRDKHLKRLNMGIFCQHLILTSTFFTVPMLLQDHLRQGHLSQTWHFYLPIMLGSFICMIPLIIWSEKKQRVPQLFKLTVGLTLLCQGLLAIFFTKWLSLCGLLFVYFIAFNFLEANLPSLVSKQANPTTKGTAMGIYSSCQFLGIFIGGTLAGLCYPLMGTMGLFFMNATVAAIWLLYGARSG